MLILIRGLPGSGKSTYAHNYTNSKGALHLESDQYWMKDGKYCFDEKKIKASHRWCLKIATISLRTGMDVIVANVFTKNEYMIPFVKIAKRYKHKVEIITLEANYGNVHQVPSDVMQKMKDDWERTNIQGVVAHDVYIGKKE